MGNTKWINDRTGKGIRKMPSELNGTEDPGFAYVVFENQNGKNIPVYAGQKGFNTQGGDWKTYKSSGPGLKERIDKSGIENFSFRVMGFFETKNERLAAEVILIRDHKTKENGCNRNPGTYKKFLTDDVSLDDKESFDAFVARISKHQNEKAVRKVRSVNLEKARNAKVFGELEGDLGGKLKDSARIRKRKIDDEYRDKIVKKVTDYYALKIAELENERDERIKQEIKNYNRK